MRLEHVIPCDPLKPFISLLAIQEVEEENTYRILPDTNIVVGFQFKGRLCLVQDDRHAWLSSAGITGLSDHYKTFKNSKETGTVLVYFKETGAAHFFGQGLYEIFSESVSLENFMLRSELLVVEDQLYNAKNDQQRISVVENFLISRLKVRQSDKLVSAALAFIHDAKGDVRISVLANHLNTSQSPLEKRFRQVVGTSPKKFASIVRMKHIIGSLDGRQSVPDCAYNTGFYDQAHFIKQFKSFTGETPTSFLRKSET